MFRGCVTGFSLCLALAAGCERSQPPTSRAVPAPTPPPAGPAPATAAPTVILGRPTGTFIDREDLLDLRLVCYNVGWNSIFPDVSANAAAKFARLMPALNPDILALQEVGLHPQDRDKSDARKWTADDVVKLMNQIAPLPKGATWHGWQGSDCVTVSKYPLKMTADTLDPPGERKLALALVDLPDEDFNVDLYILNNHFKCCDAEKNDPLRQQQSDALVAWLRDARTPGGKLDLPKATALVIVGDLNIVGSVQPIETLVRGDIQDERSTVTIRARLG
jgi:endonuclease/exonuclease/phosphatase family metal-dependent hydrolase